MESFGGVTLNNLNPVQQGKIVYLPAESKSFELDTQTGTEKIYFLASRTRDDDLEAALVNHPLRSEVFARSRVYRCLDESRVETRPAPTRRAAQTP